MQPPVYSPGELGKLAMQYAHGLARLGWARFLRQHHHHRFPSTSPHLDAPPAAVKELERQLSINEDVLRYLTIRVEELDLELSPILARRDRERERETRREDAY